MMEKRDLLFEIGTEEIPARFLPPAIKQITELAEKELAAAGLNYEALKVYATPRRLTLMVTALDTQQPDLQTEAKGPALKAAYDAEGKPTRALEGFCRSQGVSVEELQQKEIGNNVYVFVSKTTAGRPAAELLPELLAGIVDKIYFPKPMRWGYGEMRFARPLRWMVALFGADVLPLTISGVTADRYTRGHRVLGSDHICINEPCQYLALLEENFVIADQVAREARVREQIAKAAASIDGVAGEDEGLVEEVVYILEYPTALVGNFDEKYLNIPDELVITPMRDHQRYFPVYNKQGELLPSFITLRNGDDYHMEVVSAGNEKVLRARLADAEFFYTEDLKADLDAELKRLEVIVFNEKLGMLSQKVARIEKLAGKIAELAAFTAEDTAAAVKTAHYAKADLVSRAVCEFTELQGIMGEYYTLAKGFELQVAQGIREHYMPRFAGDEVPETKAGMAVAIADKLDSLCGFFAIGMIPSGSQDPYALRRAAAGVVQIILRRGLTLPLAELCGYAFDLYAAECEAVQAADKQQTVDALLAFMQQRWENVAAETLPADVIRAVSAVSCDDLLDQLHRAEALVAFRGGAEFARLQGAFTRAANLLRAADKKEKIAIDTLAVNEDLLLVDAEKQLHASLTAVQAQVAPLVAARDYAAALAAISGIADATDAFFADVMVMDENTAIRDNRLALLKAIRSLTAAIADLSLLTA